MGIQTILCKPQTVWLLAVLQSIEAMERRAKLRDLVLDDFFLSPGSKTTWDVITAAIGPFGCSKMVPTGANASKPARQGDSSQSPYQIDRHPACVSAMYETCLSAGVLKNPTEMDIPVYPENVTEQLQHQTAMNRWNAVISAFEANFDIESSLAVLFEAIKPLYHSTLKFSKSPSQLYFYGGNKILGSIFYASAVRHVAWSVIDELFPDIRDVILSGDVSDLWWLPVPVVSVSGTFTLSSVNEDVYYEGDGVPVCVEKDLYSLPDEFDAKKFSFTHATETGTLSYRIMTKGYPS